MIEGKLQRAEELLRQIQQQKLQVQHLYDEATRETYWLRPGDVVVTYDRRRRGLTRRVVATPYYWLVVDITSYAEFRFKEGTATVWVRSIFPPTGEVSPVAGMCLQHYQLNTIEKIGHVDDHDNISTVNLAALTLTKRHEGTTWNTTKLQTAPTIS